MRQILTRLKTCNYVLLVFLYNIFNYSSSNDSKWKFIYRILYNIKTYIYIIYLYISFFLIKIMNVQNFLIYRKRLKFNLKYYISKAILL